MSNADVSRAVLDAYLAQDREAAERLIGEDFVFTSPQDDHLDRATFFERCFPASINLDNHEVLHVVPISDDDVFVQYEYDSLQGGRYRNVELQTVRGGQLVETQVFFGGRVHP
jgi:ketosteroid isomerase-like protein